MSTGKILKNSAPHQVKMREGSKDAQRKPVKVKTEAEPVQEAVGRKLKTESIKTNSVPVKVKSLPPKAKPEPVKLKTDAPPKKAAAVKLPSSSTPSRRVPLPTAVVVPPTIAKKSIAKVKPKIQEKPIPVDSSSKPTVTVPPPVDLAPPPDHELWETDSPVMRRISLLRSRNAQLNEQVQRLKKPA